METEGDPRSTFLVLLAEQLHLSGTTTDRLESMVTRAAAVLQVELHIFATPTNITLAIGPAYRQQVVMLRVKPGSLDLRALAVLTEVYDALCSGKLQPAEAIAHVQEIIRNRRPAPVWITVGSFCLVSIGTSLLLGADTREVYVAATIGLSTGIIAAFASRFPVAARLFEVLATFFGTLIVAAYNHFIGPTNLYISIISGIVPLLPGYSLTSALYELANSDLVAGMARLGKVFATVLELGCGAALAIIITGTAILSGDNNNPHPVGMLTWTLAIVFMTTGLSAVLNARIKDYVWIFAACFIALLTSRVLGTLPGHQAAAFGAAFVSGLVSNLGARFLRVPQLVLLVPAVFVLVPGALTYESVASLFAQNFTTAAGLGVNAIIASVFIVAGLLLSQLLFSTAGRLVQGVAIIGDAFPGSSEK
ncbi:MAG: threonine/serine exporter family protein [Candidatus Eremiobacteraeota bacterium]|nr:threonine/serine exporter family protein [Candidatus Eremiobacteraeota bacterium]